MTEVAEVETQAALDEILAANETVVVNFTAPSWCVPCQRFSPHFEAAAAKLAADVKFVKVDVDKADRGLLDSYSVQSVPTVKGYRNGNFKQDVKARTALPLLQEVSTL